MKKIRIKNSKLVFIILIISLFALFLLYYNFVFSKALARNAFVDEMVEVVDQNELAIFNVQKTISYSSAHAVDNSSDHSLKNMTISQYSDISIYIDNTNVITDLTNENTIKQLYIDNINITSNSEKGTKILNYKNPLNFGKYKKLDNPENNRIDFNIISTNSENESTDYSKPTFYTDCSNPITLGYINKDILTNYSVSPGSSTVSFNGKVLKEAKLSLEELSYTLNFRINIVNNLNQKFTYNMSFDSELDDDNGGIYNGYIYKTNTTSGKNYNFFKSLN